MTLNNFLAAVASKLTEIWPDRKVKVNDIPKDADGNFYVGIIESDQEAKLDRRRKRAIQFEVLYFMKSNDNMEFNAWAEVMYDDFERLDVKESEERTRSIRLINRKARKDQDRFFQFLFDVDFMFFVAPEPVPTMEKLDQREVMK